MLINGESESHLLALFLRNTQQVGARCVESGLTSEAFSSQDNQQLYRWLLSVWSSGETIEPYRIVFDIRKAGLLDAVGGTERLQELSRDNPPEAVTQSLIDELKDLATRRRLLAVCKSAYDSLQADTSTPEISASLNAALSQQQGEATIHAPTPRELSRELINRAESSSVVRTGFKAIDSDCGGLYLGNFLVVAGGTKAGKSALAGNIARNIARSRFVAVFTVEMSRIEFWQRIVNAAAGVSSNYWHPDYTQSAWQQAQVMGAMESLNNARMTVIDSVLCIEQAFAICQALKAKHGELGAVVIDYLQLFSTPEKTGSRAEAVAAVSRACKRWATKLQTLVIGVSQLNDDGKSLESRGIQRDANLMLNVLVEENGTRNVVSAFNRNGPMGMILPLEAQLQYNRFIDR